MATSSVNHRDTLGIPHIVPTIMMNHRTLFQAEDWLTKIKHGLRNDILSPCFIDMHYKKSAFSNQPSRFQFTHSLLPGFSPYPSVADGAAGCLSGRSPPAGKPPLPPPIWPGLFSEPSLVVTSPPLLA